MQTIILYLKLITIKNSTILHWINFDDQLKILALAFILEGGNWEFSEFQSNFFLQKEV